MVGAFVVTALIGALLLMLPVARQGSGGAPFSVALFTSMSAVCVTGLAVVDTPGYWTGFGQGVILALFQAGGLGIMTLSSILVILISRRLGFKQRLIAQAQTGSLQVGDVRQLVVSIIRMTLIVEAVATVLITIRLWWSHGETLGRAFYLAVFHAVSAFNNAGFSLYSDSLIGFQRDPWMLTVIMVAVIVGGMGFPVWREVAATRLPSQWNLHTKITVLTTVVLLVVGGVAFTLFEWTNPGTLGGLPAGDTALNGIFQSVTTRTAGFNTVDQGQLNETSHLMSLILMFIGAGSGSTGGGIKVTTFAILGWVMWAQVRGEKDVSVFRRRVPSDIQRQALTVALMAIGVVVVVTMALLALTPFDLTEASFEAVSALGTVGLSTGVTPDLEGLSRFLIIGVMLLGRVGPPTLFAALVLRSNQRLYRPPEERIIIG